MKLRESVSKLNGVINGNECLYIDLCCCCHLIFSSIEQLKQKNKYRKFLTIEGIRILMGFGVHKYHE